MVVFAILGLTPSWSWIPEIVLLPGGALVPILALTLTGYWAGRKTGEISDGLFAGGVAGSIAGLAGGVSYVVYGKPWINVPFLLIAFAVQGIVLGFAGAFVAVRRRR